ncbi:MAG: HD domain-containing protein [Nitrospirae bacterium]|nr:HD domain-containing protein [Nitrospirota bacterium]
MTEGKISDFTASVMAALSNYALYSGKHPIVDEFSERAFSLVKDLYAGDTISLALIGDSLVFNDRPVSEKGMHIDNFIMRLRRKGVEKIEIRKGVTLEEFKRFIAGMITRDTSFASTHISVGIVEVTTTEDKYSIKAVLEENIEKVKEVFDKISSRDAKLDVRSLEATVTSLMALLKRDPNVLTILSPVRKHDEYPYVHAINVAILTLFQAEAMSVSDGLISDIGLAGLLHDVGKLFVPKEVIDKQTELDQHEWNLMRLHPLHGAMYLSSLPDIPKLAMIAAYEHHIKFDRSGYPDIHRDNRSQHPVSQMVAVADFFEVMRTERPYRRSAESGAIVNFLHQRAGEDFNPVIVDQFAASFAAVNAI